MEKALKEEDSEQPGHKQQKIRQTADLGGPWSQEIRPDEIPTDKTTPESKPTNRQKIIKVKKHKVNTITSDEVVTGLPSSRSLEPILRKLSSFCS